MSSAKTERSAMAMDKEQYETEIRIFRDRKEVAQVMIIIGVVLFSFLLFTFLNKENYE